jgi:hypothetical protein
MAFLKTALACTDAGEAQVVVTSKAKAACVHRLIGCAHNIAAGTSSAANLRISFDKSDSCLIYDLSSEVPANSTMEGELYGQRVITLERSLFPHRRVESWRRVPMDHQILEPLDSESYLFEKLRKP